MYATRLSVNDLWQAGNWCINIKPIDNQLGIIKIVFTIIQSFIIALKLWLSQLWLVQVKQLLIWFIILWVVSSLIVALGSWRLPTPTMSPLLDQTRFVIADVLNSLDGLLTFLFPIKHVVVWILLLQPLQESFVFIGDPLHISLPCNIVQALVLGNARFLFYRDASFNFVCWLWPWSCLFFLKMRNWRHIAFLVLGEINSRAGQDACHLLK